MNPSPVMSSDESAAPSIVAGFEDHVVARPEVALDQRVVLDLRDPNGRIPVQGHPVRHAEVPVQDVDVAVVPGVADGEVVRIVVPFTARIAAPNPP